MLSTDRVFFEMTALIDAVHIGGTYDCLNVGGCAMIESLCRRIQAIVNAYEKNPSKPNYQRVSLFTGVRSAIDAIDPELRSYTSKPEKEQRDQSGGGGGLWAGGWNADYVPAAVDAGGLPLVDDKGEGKRKGKKDKGAGAADGAAPKLC